MRQCRIACPQAWRIDKTTGTGSGPNGARPYFRSAASGASLLYRFVGLAFLPWSFPRPLADAGASAWFGSFSHLVGMTLSKYFRSLAPTMDSITLPFAPITKLVGLAAPN